MSRGEHQISPHNFGRGKSPITIVRDCLTFLTPEIIDRLSYVDEMAMRAKIIAEHMQQNAIHDINEGIRSFIAFERHRLQQLGIIAPRDGRATSAAAGTGRLVIAGQQG